MFALPDFLFRLVLILLICMDFQILKVECHVDKTQNFRHHFLFTLNRHAKVPKLIVRFEMRMGKEQRLNVPSAAGFSTSKIGILTSRTEYPPVDQMISIKNDWIIPSWFLNSSPNDQRIVAAYEVFKNKQCWIIYFQWAMFRN